MPARVRETNSVAAASWAATVAATERAFTAFIAHPTFPCVGAKSALTQGRLHLLCARDLTSASEDWRITHALQTFAAQRTEASLFVSFALLFPRSPRLDEAAFEAALWQRLHAMHALDRVDHAWDASVSADPSSAQFNTSVGGKAFFVVGLHPAASRRARRFRCPTLVFNLHGQFGRLRAAGHYEKLPQAIVRRDIAYSGSANLMLAVPGASSEAAQYSGRQVGAEWVCPFHSAAPQAPS